MKHLRWGAVGLCITALAACDSTPADPDAGDAGADGAMAVTAPVLGAVPVLNEADGHLYEAVAVAGGINWADAKTAAEAMTSGTCQGYLASITSTEENDFILSNFPAVVPSIGGSGYWIGGFQNAETTPADAGWMWVSGEAFGFADWISGAPDDGGPLADEDAIHFVSVSTGGFGGEVGWDDLNQTLNTPGYVVEFDGSCSDSEILDVMLKLKQGEGARVINLKSRGKIAAAVLSAADSGAGDGFDATAIDPLTVTLGDGVDPDAHVAANPKGKLMVSWPDLNDDGLDDALFHFNTQDLVAAGLNSATTELVLRGTTTGGASFSGSDAVVVIQPK
jgi:hypothetical protein